MNIFLSSNVISETLSSKPCQVQQEKATTTLPSFLNIKGVSCSINCVCICRATICQHLYDLEEKCGFLALLLYTVHCCVYFKKDHAKKREFHERWIYNPTQTLVLCIKLIFHSLNTNMHCKEFIPQQCTSGYEESCTHYQSKTVSYIILLKDKDQYATAN